MRFLPWPTSLSFLLLVSSFAWSQSAVVGGFIGVKGAPLSADFVTESSRIPRDGSMRRHETRMKIYRDSEGRTRGEFEPESRGGAKEVQVSIVDPVGQITIALDQQTKTATVTHMKAPVTPEEAGPTPQERMPGMKTEKIESKRIDGYDVSGTRVEIPIDAGPGGKATVLVTETWYSPDLKAPLLAITADPQSGQTTIRLTNIRRGDLDPRLFQVPPGYKVKDVPNEQ